MVKSINLVRRKSQKSEAVYSCLEFDLGYKKHNVFLPADDLKIIFGLTDEQLFSMKVGESKPLVLGRL